MKSNLLLSLYVCSGTDESNVLSYILQKCSATDKARVFNSDCYATRHKEN